MLEVLGVELRRRHPMRAAALFFLGVAAGSFVALMLAGPTAAQLRARVRRVGGNGAGDRADLTGDTIGNP